MQGDIELINSTVLIFGTGDIGRLLAQYLRGMNCKRIIGVNRHGKTLPLFDECIALSDAEKYLPHANIIVSIMPENAESIGYWSMKRFSMLQGKALYLNIGRGSSVKLCDVVAALKNGYISGAALDVCDPETISLWNKVRLTKRLIITNHSSSQSDSNQYRLVELMIKQLNRFFDNSNVEHIVRY